MKLRRIALVLALVALLVVGLASCVKPPQGGTTNPPQGTTAPQGEMYTVTFDGVDGVPSQLVAAGSPVAQPAKPEKENYSFDGWYVNGEKWNFNKPVEGNLTLTAKFSPKEYAITYNLGGVDAENPNPDTYAYSEDADLYLAPLTDPADEMFFLGWSTPAIEAGASGEIEVTARWIAKEKVLRNYGFEANDASGKTYIHYSEMQGEADDESTWWEAPNGTKQYYQSTTGSGSTGLHIQAEWNPRLNHTTGVEVFQGWKNEKTLPVIEYGKNADGEIVNAWFSTTYGPKVVNGFQTFTANEPYSVSAFFGFYDAVKAGGVEDVVINVDFRMIGEGAFPINFYLRGGSNYDNGQNRVLALAIAGNGDIVVGEDTIDERRVVYVDGNGNKINKSVIGNVGDGKWHTISMEMTQSSVGYDVVIKVDGEKLGNTLSMKTNINFAGENALTQLMIFGGNSATVAQVEALGSDYKCTCEFDNFVIYAK